MSGGTFKARFVALVLGATLLVGATSGIARAATQTARAVAIENAAADCTAGSSCTLEWDAIKKPVRVYGGTSVDGIDRKQALAQVPAGESGTTITGFDPTARTYFALVAGSGAGTIVADRSLHLESAPNARDLGGYRTSDGHTVKCGTVFRTDALSKSTDADLDRLTDLGIKVVCDFRGPSEVTADGADKLPAGAELVSLPVFDASNDQNAKIRAAIVSNDRAQQEAVFGGGRPAQILTEGGKFFVNDATARQQFATMLERLADKRQLPIVLHCTAGKDRTWASAVLLTILGVPRETVFEDYLATNTYHRRAERVTHQVGGPPALRPGAAPSAHRGAARVPAGIVRRGRRRVRVVRQVHHQGARGRQGDAREDPGQLVELTPERLTRSPGRRGRCSWSRRSSTRFRRPSCRTRPACPSSRGTCSRSSPAGLR
jgi:protein-tyrosine phosphatase